MNVVGGTHSNVHRTCVCSKQKKKYIIFFIICNRRNGFDCVEDVFLFIFFIAVLCHACKIVLNRQTDKAICVCDCLLYNAEKVDNLSFVCRDLLLLFSLFASYIQLSECCLRILTYVVFAIVFLSSTRSKMTQKSTCLKNDKPQKISKIWKIPTTNQRIKLGIESMIFYKRQMRTTNLRINRMPAICSNQIVRCD